MPKRKRDIDTDARNRGVEEQAERLREPQSSPPRRAADRPSPAVPDAAGEDRPAAPEHLENPPQVESPRERVNEGNHG